METKELWTHLQGAYIGQGSFRVHDADVVTDVTRKGVRGAKFEDRKKQIGRKTDTQFQQEVF